MNWTIPASKTSTGRWLRSRRIVAGLDEVRSTLLALGQMREAVVAVDLDDAGEQRLIAYALTTLSPSDIRRAMATKLPDFLVPSVVVTLESWPLNSNGKLDRDRLPTPTAPSQVTYRPRHGHLEELLADVLADLFGTGRVSAHDSFFDLGIHSCQGARHTGVRGAARPEHQGDRRDLRGRAGRNRGRAARQFL